MRCIRPFYIKNPKTNEVLSLPCGNCISCLTNRREQWAIRLIEEAKTVDFKYFLTLTYDDENLCYGSGENPTLVKMDLQYYLKRLRKLCPVESIRFYAVGEYGTKTLRAHYHLLIFSRFSVSDYVFNKAWGKGFVTVAPINIRRLYYTTKYHVNKGLYPDGCIPPFALMSKGIGKSYLTRKTRRYHKSNLKNMFYSLNEWKKPLPRYYRDKIYNKIDKEAFKTLKNGKEVSISEIVRFNQDHSKESYFKYMQNVNEKANSNFKVKVNYSQKI